MPHLTQYVCFLWTVIFRNFCNNFGVSLLSLDLLRAVFLTQFLPFYYSYVLPQMIQQYSSIKNYVSRLNFSLSLLYWHGF